MDDVELSLLSQLPLLVAKGLLLSFLPEFLTLSIALCVSEPLVVDGGAPLAVEGGAGGMGGILLLSGIIWRCIEESSCWQASV